MCSSSRRLPVVADFRRPCYRQGTIPRLFPVGKLINCPKCFSLGVWFDGQLIHALERVEMQAMGETFWALSITSHCEVSAAGRDIILARAY